MKEEEEEEKKEEMIPCEAELVSKTVSDLSVIVAGESFEQKWTLRNIGGCNWPSNVTLVSTEGDKLSRNVTTLP